MFLLILVSVVLMAFHPGKATVLRTSQEEPVDAHTSPIIRTNRCLGDPLQSIRKSILDSLNLQTEPEVSLPGIVHIRDQWINTLKGSSDSEATNLQMTDNTTSSQTTNLTPSRCCKFASQIFIKDLGWDNWIIYPESFTYNQCSLCDHQGNIQCPEDDPSALDLASQKPCCKAISHDYLPFLYLDETSTLVIASVPLTSECGCNHGEHPLGPNP